MQRGGRPVLAAEIERLSLRTGYECDWRHDADPESVVLGGNFALKRFGDGLHVHVTSGVEMSDATSSFMLGPALTIFVLLEGYLAFTIDGELWELGADDGENVACGLIWSRTRDTRVDRHMRRGRHVCKLGITLENAWFEGLDLTLPAALDVFRRVHLAQIQWCPSARALRNTHDIVRSAEATNLQSRLAIQHKALQIVQEAFELYEGELSSDGGHEVVPGGSRIRDYLDSTLDLDLSLEQIGRQLGMSVTVLQDRFRETFGITIGEYRRQQRLVRAMHAIRDHGMSVGEAAALAGYRSPANFATAFGRHFGYPPSRARG